MELGYVNGKFVSLDEKCDPIDERGHQFGDGVYEVIRFYGGKPFMLAEHLERLMKSAKAIRLPVTQSADDFRQIISTAVEKSGLSDCYVYLQITRGIAKRNHLFPDVPVSVTMTVREATPLAAEVREKGVSAITREDERWANCYIKSLNLLPNILAKQEAHDAGAFEAILIRDGVVTEGSSSNVFIVKNGTVITPPLSKHILAGITRMAVLNILKETGIPYEEKNFSEKELLGADEVFITSTTSEVLPVVSINGLPVGSGKPGELTKRIYKEFQKRIP